MEDNSEEIKAKDNSEEETDQPATQKSKRDSDDDDSVMVILKKQRKEDNSEEIKAKDNSEEETTDEDVFESLYHQKEIAVSNLDLKTTATDLLKFFDPVSSHKIVKKLIVNYVNKYPVNKYAVVEFSTPEEATKALKLKGSPIHGQTVNVIRNKNQREILCVHGFPSRLSESTIEGQLTRVFRSCGKILRFFHLKDTNGILLRTSYILIDQQGIKDPAKKLSDVQITKTGGYSIVHWYAGLRLNVCSAKMLHSGSDVSYMRKKDFLYLKELQRFEKLNLHQGHKSEICTVYSTRPELIGDHVIQTKPDCWAHALAKGHRAAVLAASSHITPLTYEMLVNGLEACYDTYGGSIGSLEHIRPFMEKHCDKMLIHRRPVSDDFEDYEKYEQKILSLLENGVPMAVAIDCLPSSYYYNGKGVYYGTPLDFLRRAHERLPKHVLLLIGHGFEVCCGERREFWKLQDSNSYLCGNGGIVRLGRHQCIIRRAVQLKVSSQGGV